MRIGVVTEIKVHESRVALTPAGADRLVYSYWRTYGIPAVILRPFNQYGPRQHLEKCVPRFVTSALTGEPLTIHAEGTAARDWVYVDDTCRAIIAALEVPLDAILGEVINVGTDRGITINELAEKVIAMTGSKSTTRHVSYEEAYGRPFDDMLVRKPCLDKVKGLIGYEPRFSLADTLNQIIEHERARPGG